MARNKTNSKMETINSPKPDITEEELAIRFAKLYTDNGSSAGFAISSILCGQAEINTLIKQIDTLSDAVINGDDRQIKSALITQSKTLGILFNTLVMTAITSKKLDGFRAYMDVALRAQNQCRKTLLALDTIQHPQQQTVVKQQNIAVNQQVNNGLPQSESKIKSENELLETTHGERLEFRTAVTAIPANTQLEAVEAGRSKNARRQGH